MCAVQSANISIAGLLTGLLAAGGVDLSCTGTVRLCGTLGDGTGIGRLGTLLAGDAVYRVGGVAFSGVVMVTASGSSSVLVSTMWTS